MRNLHIVMRGIAVLIAIALYALLTGCGGGGSDTPEQIGPAMHCERTASGTEICTEIDPDHVQLDRLDRSQAQ